MIDDIIKKIAPTGVLRVGVNMSNFLLVNSKDKLGVIDGVSPGIGKKLAKELNISFEIVQFANPGLLADAVDNNEWDIGNIASEKERGKTIDFSDPYVNIDANFLFREEDNFKNNNDIDQSGIKIAVFERSAYDLWLTENFKKAELIRVNSIEESHNLFKENKVNILAGLKPKLIDEMKKNNNYEMIQSPFTYIKQSIGIKKGNPKVLDYINKFVSNKIKEGYVKSLLQKYSVQDKLSIPKIS
jgi:polar amino acid transport system substrate-binding protein